MIVPQEVRRKPTSGRCILAPCCMRGRHETSPLDLGKLRDRQCICHSTLRLSLRKSTRATYRPADGNGTSERLKNERFSTTALVCRTAFCILTTWEAELLEGIPYYFIWEIYQCLGIRLTLAGPVRTCRQTFSAAPTLSHLRCIEANNRSDFARYRTS